ncbi:hypothetical protein NP233_g1676 [Leucocoprinus birnbaumii]|uniref:Uncharacterized protein n=1 Tax=Leucocoprinus birnbaumii TaxID=56174 RepID=A0AAD5YVK6_9AGAR|nr:hypothetical protein NP233_g1676 [Leucocoprinus birnbaumii]
MTASVLRSRMLRKHPKRRPGFIGDAISNVLDDAKDGKFGSKAQGLADALSSGKGGSGFPNFPNHGSGNQGNNGNSGSNSGGNSGQGNGGGGGSSGGSSSSNNGNGNGSSTGNNNNSNGGGGGSGKDSNNADSNNPSSGSSGGSNGGSHNAPSSNSGSAGGDNDGGSSGSSNDNKDSSKDSDSDPPFTSPVANAGSEFIHFFASLSESLIVPLDVLGTSSTHRSETGSSPSPSIFVSAIVPTGAASTPGAIFSDTASIPSATSTAPEAQSDVSQSNNRGAIAGGIVGALLFLFLVYGAWLVYKRRRKSQLPPSAEFVNNPSAYPFARAGFGNTTAADEKSGVSGGKYGGAGTGAAGQAKFKPFSADSAEGMLSEKGPQMGQYRDNYSQPLPPPPQPEVLYTTPARVSTPPSVPSSAPGTPTTPNGRRIPFGTGTFQFPPRPPQPQPQPR